MSALIPGMGMHAGYPFTSSAPGFTSPAELVRLVLISLSFIGFLAYNHFWTLLGPAPNPVIARRESPKAHFQSAPESPKCMDEKYDNTSHEASDEESCSDEALSPTPTIKRSDTFGMIRNRSNDGNDFEDILAKGCIKMLRYEITQLFNRLPNHKHRVLTGEEYINFVDTLMHPVTRDPGIALRIALKQLLKESEKVCPTDIKEGLHRVARIKEKVGAMIKAQREVRRWEMELGLVYDTEDRFEGLLARVEYLLQD